MQEYVFLKGKKDRLLIQLDEDIDFESLREKVIIKMKQAEALIGNAPIAIEFNKRLLSYEEERVLVEDINQNTNIKIAFLITDDEHFKDFLKKTEEEFKKNNQIQVVKIKKDEKVENKPKEISTKLHKGTVRSGRVLEYDGNIVILGDVNPGAIIKATGSVLVLGYLNGSVYIENKNNENNFVGALSLNPIQIKIGDVLTKNPSKDILNINKIKKELMFEVAYLDEQNMIYVEKFSKNLLEKLMK